MPAWYLPQYIGYIGDVEGALTPWSALRLNSKLKVEKQAMRDGWAEFQSPARPGKEAGTEADVQVHAPGRRPGPTSRHGRRQGPPDAAVLRGLFRDCPGNVGDGVDGVAVRRFLTQAGQRQSSV